MCGFVLLAPQVCMRCIGAPSFSLTRVIPAGVVLVLLPARRALRWFASGLALAPPWQPRRTQGHYYRRRWTPPKMAVAAVWMEQEAALALRSAPQGPVQAMVLVKWLAVRLLPCARAGSQSVLAAWPEMGPEKRLEVVVWALGDRSHVRAELPDDRDHPEPSR
jgi:hypothetical protein